MSKISEPLTKAWLVALVAASLTACGGGGGGDSNPPPSGTQPPPAPAPPPPPPPAPPPSSSDAPPLASSATDISAGQRIGTIHWANGNTGNGGTGGAVDGIECLLNMPDTYHAHAYVGIYLNGELLAVPSSVGIVTRTPDPRCYYAIHTHDMSGQIHVEAAAQGTFTLGQLFNIWGQPLESTNVAGLTGNPVEIFVVENGVVTEVDNNWGDIELTSKKMIHIVVGTRPSELRNITWTGN
jgi:hypothetical protein